MYRETKFINSAVVTIWFGLSRRILTVFGRLEKPLQSSVYSFRIMRVIWIFKPIVAHKMGKEESCFLDRLAEEQNTQTSKCRRETIYDEGEMFECPNPECYKVFSPRKRPEFGVIRERCLLQPNGVLEELSRDDSHDLRRFRPQCHPKNTAKLYSTIRSRHRAGATDSGARNKGDRR